MSRHPEKVLLFPRAGIGVEVTNSARCTIKGAPCWPLVARIFDWFEHRLHAADVGDSDRCQISIRSPNGKAGLGIAG